MAINIIKRLKSQRLFICDQCKTLQRGYIYVNYSDTAKMTTLCEDCAQAALYEKRQQLKQSQQQGGK